MEALLKQLTESFKLEKDNLSASLSARQGIVEQYRFTLDRFVGELNQAVARYKIELVPIENQKRKLLEQIDSLTTQQHEMSKLYSDKVSGLSFQAESLQKDIKELEDKQGSLNRVNAGLMTEYRGIEDQLVTLRGNISALERRAKELADKEAKLKITSNSQIEESAYLTSEIDQKKADFNRLSNDVLVLETRLKKLK